MWLSLENEFVCIIWITKLLTPGELLIISTLFPVRLLEWKILFKLRVYPALFELEQAGYIEVVEREELGAPLAVRRRRDASQVLHDSM